jgi:hypothetical protein
VDSHADSQGQSVLALLEVTVAEGVAGVGGHAELRVDDTAWRVRYRDVDQSERKVMSRTFTATLTLRCRRAGGGRGADD